MLNSLKNGSKNYILTKKLSRLKIDGESNPKFMFFVFSKAIEPLEKIPRNVIWKMKESGANPALIETLENWNGSVFFAESMNRAFKEKYFSDLNKNELTQLQYSFFKLNRALSKVLSSPEYAFNSLAVYAESVINTDYPELGDEAYLFFKKEHKELRKGFVQGIRDGVFSLSFNEKEKNYMVQTKTGQFRIPEEAVADMAFGLIEMGDKDTFKQYSEVFLSTITNERFEKLPSDRKVEILNFITSDRDYTKQVPLSFDKDNIKEMIKETEYYLQMIKEDVYISPRYKKELLNEKGKSLLALAQSFVFQNIKQFLGSRKAGDALIEEHKGIKEENYSVLKEVSEEISKTTGDADVRESFKTFGENVKNYLKDTKGIGIRTI